MVAPSLECRCILAVTHTHTVCPSWNTGLFSRHLEFLKQRMRGRLERGINCHYAGGPEIEEMRGRGKEEKHFSLLLVQFPLNIHLTWRPDRGNYDNVALRNKAPAMQARRLRALQQARAVG